MKHYQLVMLGLGALVSTHLFGNEAVINSPADTTTVTAKNKILIHGKTPFNEAVFVNGKPIEVQPGGQFHDRYSMAIPNKETLVITVLDAEKTPHHTSRHVITLPGPSDISSLNDPLRSDYLYTLNSPFIHESMTRKNLFQPVSRAELAYLSYALLKPTEKPAPSVHYPDVPDDHWAKPAINHLVATGVMREYMDGQFYPEKTISRFEYIITVVRALQLTSKSEAPSLPYNDIDPNTWTTPFVQLAYTHNLLPNTYQLNGNALLSYQTFLSLLNRIPDVQAHIKAQRSAPVPSVDMPSIMALIEAYNRQPNTTITFDTVKNGDIIYSPTTTLSVTVLPAEPFEFNRIQRIPDASGVQKIPLSVFEPGPIPITVTSGLIKKTIVIYYFPWYPELNNHWMGSTLSRLRYIRKVATPRPFKPTQTMTRAEFKSLFLWVTGLPATTQTTAWFSDTGGQRLMTRAEAGAAIAKFIGHTPTTVSTMDNSVFEDVPNGHWFRPYLFTLLDADIVRANTQFKLNRPITQAEMVHMLSQTSPIQTELDAAL